MAATFIAIGSAVKAGVSALSSSIFSAFGGGTAASAAGGATTASSISTALSIGSALSSVAAGFSSASAQREQARQVQVQAAQQQTQDAQRRASLAEEYADLLSEQTAIQIANGLNPGVGTPATVRAATTEIAERNLSTSRENTRNRARVARLQSRSLMRSANTSILRGVTQAGAIGLDAYRAVG